MGWNHQLVIYWFISILLIDVYSEFGHFSRNTRYFLQQNLLMIKQKQWWALLKIKPTSDLNGVQTADFWTTTKRTAWRYFSCLPNLPKDPCMVHSPTFYHKNQPNVGVYTIHGWYGNCQNQPTAKRFSGLDTPGGEHVFDDTSTGCGQVTSSGTRTHWIFDLALGIDGCFDQWLFFWKNLIKHYNGTIYKLGWKNINYRS